MGAVHGIRRRGDRCTQNHLKLLCGWWALILLKSPSSAVFYWQLLRRPRRKKQKIVTAFSLVGTHLFEAFAVHLFFHDVDLDRDFESCHMFAAIFFDSKNCGFRIFWFQQAYIGA